MNITWSPGLCARLAPRCIVRVIELKSSNTRSFLLPESFADRILCYSGSGERVEYTHSSTAPGRSSTRLESWICRARGALTMCEERCAVGDSRLYMYMCALT